MRAVVALAVVPAEVSPEAELRALFRAEREAERLLKETRAAMSTARRVYAIKHSLLILPSFDRLRELFS